MNLTIQYKDLDTKILLFKVLFINKAFPLSHFIHNEPPRRKMAALRVLGCPELLEEILKFTPVVKTAIKLRCVSRVLQNDLTDDYINHVGKKYPSDHSAVNSALSEYYDIFETFLCCALCTIPSNAAVVFCG